MPSYLKYSKDLEGYAKLMEQLLTDLETLRDIPTDFLYEIDSASGTNYSDDDDLYDNAEDIRSAIQHSYELVYAFVNKIRRRVRDD